MGKTCTLTAVERLLLEENRFLVGYHESKGQSGHLLYAVSDLYARWLEEASMRNQAISLWERNKGNAIPNIGQMVGVLLEKLVGKQLPVAGALLAAFDWLAEASRRCHLRRTGAYAVRL
ncbi:hypothetical protein SAMN05443245_6878 [Paraburkholderia fungorum]|uniref:Uncharacterized protein n=2 Tax=Paraburkholderia fungorum TaxID=134537 RepID=A0A1H1JNM0_9BURK|nr:hypothetical protein SAMN05443245_6878 [Paraburkholderia fungorum]